MVVTELWTDENILNDQLTARYFLLSGEELSQDLWLTAYGLFPEMSIVQHLSQQVTILERKRQKSQHTIEYKHGYKQGKQQIRQKFNFPSQAYKIMLGTQPLTVLRWKDIQPQDAIWFQGIPRTITIQDEKGSNPWKVEGTEAFQVKNFLRLALTDCSSSTYYTLTNGDMTFDPQQKLAAYPVLEDGICIIQQIKMTQQLDPA